MKFRVGVFLALYLAALAGQARAAEPSPPHRENNPHMGAFEQPVLWERDMIRIEAPTGYPVCSVLESYSSWLMFFVPIDPATPCEKFPLDSDWEKFPDFVVVDPYYDASLDTPELADYIRKWQTFFCAGKRQGGNASDAPTARAPAGKRLMGLETVTCTRADNKSDRYTKAYVAYKPDPINLEGRGYTVGAFVHLKNRKAADRLLEQVVKLLKPLE